jgi:hypothetical protein
VHNPVDFIFTVVAPMGKSLLGYPFVNSNLETEEANAEGTRLHLNINQRTCICPCYY